MTIPFEVYIATRYLLARRRQAFISLISVVSIGGVAVGVMALVIALALMTGMQQDIRDKLIGAQAHVYVHKIIAGGFDDYRAEAERLFTTLTLDIQILWLQNVPIISAKLKLMVDN